MNRHATLIVLALASASAVGCSGTQSNTPRTEPTTTTTTTTTTTNTTPSNTTPSNTTPPDQTADRVCCESFGYGARMVECCQRVEWTTAAACTVPPGHVGGGRRVVDNARCAAAPAAGAAPSALPST